MDITGVIHNGLIDDKIFSMKIKGKIEYFYMQTSLMKKFKKYLHKGSFVSFNVSDESKVIGKIKCKRIEYFNKILKNSSFRATSYYDLEQIRSGIKDFLNSFDNVMFLDLEMTMQDYVKTNKVFVPEIIQAGILVSDKNKNVLENHSYYILPTKTKRISKRTFKFLNIEKEVFDNAISYNDFYELFDELNKKYNPFVIVWGKNDILVLKDSFKLNNKESIDLRFVNLLQIIKNYYNLKQDLGLFKALQMFNGQFEVQSHDALDDAYKTKEVFYSFKEVINGKN